MSVQKEAILWEPAGGGAVRCGLCAWRCVIAEGRTGRCGVRRNTSGTLYSLNYHRLCASAADPIEKKPFFHFLPGSDIYSIAAVGCNFRCVFCQNWQISQQPFLRDRMCRPLRCETISPAAIVDAAVSAGCAGIAYTYTEPTVFMELCADCACMARDRGLANVFVSNGYMTNEAIDLACEWLDAINVDLKSFSDRFYRTMCKATLQPVLDTISHIASSTEIWMEVTTLLIPGRNDSDAELSALAGFLVEHAGPDVPWHVSRFFPNYRLADQPATDPCDLQRAVETGRKAGLRYIYTGNVPGSNGENSFCFNCGGILVERFGYSITANFLKDGRCPDCGTAIAGRWKGEQR